MKTLCLALALAAAPAVASAQVAAGAIPNTFDAQARPAVPVSQAAAPRTPPETPAAATEPASPKAEETLRAFISGAQNDSIDYSMMTDDLSAKMRAQSASVAKVIKDLGPVQAVDWMGQMEGADVFLVAFDRGAVEWLVGFTPEGRLAAILFRPVPAADASAASRQ